MLYDSDWNPNQLGDFESDKLIQDFSYAGYHGGTREIPDIDVNIIDVTQPPYSADNTGRYDSTKSIQAAINDASQQGGVVYLPNGHYLLSVEDGSKAALSLNTGRIVIRGDGIGKTFLVNTTTQMRGKSVIAVQPRSNHGSFFENHTNTQKSLITKDLKYPTKLIPVDNAAIFQPGDLVSIRHDMTIPWIKEHGGENSWEKQINPLKGPTYYRQVVDIDISNGVIVIDSPIRYYLKTRDSTTVYKLSSKPITEVGLEGFSLANIEHSSDKWGEKDYTTKGTGAYDVNGSYLITFERARNCWAKNIRSFRPSQNRTKTNLLSNGILINQSSRITLADINLKNTQYGGAGGNGYLYRMQNANDCLIIRCKAKFARRCFVFTHAGSSGNVLHDCYASQSGRAIGHTGQYTTDGSGSDHHMQFSHSNLVDQCTSNESSWEARYRPHPKGAGILHGITSAHSVFWNIRSYGNIVMPAVVSEQARYGYVIGTSGNRSAVETPNYGDHRTLPRDHVEGVGNGGFLRPASLYLDQLRKNTHKKYH